MTKYRIISKEMVSSNDGIGFEKSKVYHVEYHDNMNSHDWDNLDFDKWRNVNFKHKELPDVTHSLESAELILEGAILMDSINKEEYVIIKEVEANVYKDAIENPSELHYAFTAVTDDYTKRYLSNNNDVTKLRTWFIKESGMEVTECTCHNCSEQMCCKFAYDLYNISGDCLLDK